MKFKHYTYVLFDGRNGLPIYIGKGSRQRMSLHVSNALRGKPLHGNKHNRKLENKIRKIYSTGSKVTAKKVLETDYPNVALACEVALIKIIGLENLCNQTTGGDGGFEMSEDARANLGAWAKGRVPWMAGRKHTPETRAKISAAVKGLKRKPCSAETRNKISARIKGIIRSAETRAKISAAHKGEKNAWYGRKLSAEEFAKFHAAGQAALKGKPGSMKGKKLSPESRLKISIAHKGRIRSPEFCAKVSAGLKGRPVSEETRAKIGASNKRIAELKRAQLELVA